MDEEFKKVNDSVELLRRMFENIKANLETANNDLKEDKRDEVKDIKHLLKDVFGLFIVIFSFSFFM